MKVSRGGQSPVHVEWAASGVRAINTVTHETAEAGQLAGLGPILSGSGALLIGIGRRDVFLKSVRLPKADPEDLRRILAVQLGQLFPIPPDLLAFDFFQTADQTPEGVLTVVAAMRAEDLRRLHAALKDAGLTAARILPVSLAAPAVAASAGQADALVLEADPAGLALDLVRGGLLVFSRIVPAASDVDCEAKRTLAAANVKALPLVSAGGAGPPDALPGFGTALGLLHNAPPFAFQLAEERAKERQKRARDRTRLATLLMLSALLLVALVWADREQAQAAAKKRQGIVARQLGRLQSVQDAAATQAQQVTAVQDVLHRAFDPAQPLSDVVSVVGDSLPAGTWLTGLNAERGKPLQLRGMAGASTDVPRLVHTLGASSRFRDVRLVFASSVTAGKARLTEFEISAVPAGNLPLPAPDKAEENKTEQNGPARTGTKETGTKETGTKETGTEETGTSQ